MVKAVHILRETDMAIDLPAALPTPLFTLISLSFSTPELAVSRTGNKYTTTFDHQSAPTYGILQMLHPAGCFLLVIIHRLSVCPFNAVRASISPRPTVNRPLGLALPRC